MTRLNTSDIEHIAGGIKKYDQQLQRQTRYSLEEIARYATGISGEVRSYKVAVIPITSGLGIIEEFSQSVCAILRYAGADAFVTEKTDLAGLQEAYERKAEMIFWADDETTSAFSLSDHSYSDNGYATGTGFAAALYLMMKQRGDGHGKALILGAGPVGRAAADYLQKKGVETYIKDCKREKVKEARKTTPGLKEYRESMTLNEFSYLLDATPVAHVITREQVSKDTVISAPGMPLGVEEDAMSVATVLHNPLELGIVTMYDHCIAQSMDAQRNQKKIVRWMYGYKEQYNNRNQTLRTEESKSVSYDR